MNYQISKVEAHGNEFNNPPITRDFGNILEFESQTKVITVNLVDQLLIRDVIDSTDPRSMAPEGFFGV